MLRQALGQSGLSLVDLAQDVIVREERHPNPDSLLTVYTFIAEELALGCSENAKGLDRLAGDLFTMTASRPKPVPVLGFDRLNTVSICWS